MTTARRSLAFVSLALLSCSRPVEDAGIVLNVDADGTVNKAAISQVVVTVDGKQQAWTLTHPLPGSLGIVTSPGTKNVAADGLADAVPLGHWSGQIVVSKGQVAMQTVILTCVACAADGGVPFLDGGAGRGGAPGTGGIVGVDGAVASGGIGGPDAAIGTGGIVGPDAAIGTGGIVGPDAAIGTGGIASGGSGGGGLTGTVIGSGGRGLGGTTGTGGATSTLSGTGGLPGTGGLVVTGGAKGTGGVTISGGASGAGGLPATGGASGSGGVVAIDAGTPGTLLFSDDFETGNAGRWTPDTAADWAVVTDDTYVYEQSVDMTTSGRWIVSSAGDTPWADVAVEARVKFLAVSTTTGIVSGAGVCARLRDSGNFYTAELLADSTLMIRRRTGTTPGGTSSVTVAAAVSVPVAVNTWYRLRLVIVGQTLKAYVDDVLLLNGTDASLTSGRVGVGTYMAKAAFDDVRVTAP